MPSAEFTMKDFADESWPGSSGQTARQLYASQKAELAALLDRMSHAIAPSPEDLDASSALLHNLAGTAVYFDEDQLGAAAAELELPTRFAIDHGALAAIAEHLLPLLGR